MSSGNLPTQGGSLIDDRDDKEVVVRYAYVKATRQALEQARLVCELSWFEGADNDDLDKEVLKLDDMLTRLGLKGSL